MAGTSSKPQGREPKISILAVASLSVAVLAALMLLLANAIAYPRSMALSALNTAALLAVFSVVVGIPALVMIEKSGGTIKGRFLTIVAMTVATLISGVWLLEQRPRSTAARAPCGANLMALGKAMMIYASRNDDRFPDPNRWCDLLIEHTRVTPRQLVCPSLVIRLPIIGTRFTRPAPARGVCSYAMNPNCKAESAPDAVLLFESNLGWNQSGGHEICSTAGHQQRGSNVLLRDTGVYFYKDVSRLNWTGTQK